MEGNVLGVHDCVDSALMPSMTSRTRVCHLEFGRVMNLRNLSMIVGGVRQLDLQPGQQVLEPGAGDGGVLRYVLFTVARDRSPLCGTG